MMVGDFVKKICQITLAHQTKIWYGTECTKSNFQNTFVTLYKGKYKGKVVVKALELM